MVKNAYKWVAPRYRRGDLVEFRWSEGRWLTAEVGYVETKYDHHGVAWHQYPLRPNGYKAGRWCAEKDMRLVRRPPQ